MNLNHPPPFFLYVGTYALCEPVPGCIQVFGFDAEAGELSGCLQVLPAINPSFFWAHPGGSHLFVVNEDRGVPGNPVGTVSQFYRDPASGRLSLMRAVPSGGSLPCHLSGNTDFIIVANYVGASVAVLPLAGALELQPPVKVARHSGNGLDAIRQQQPHPHGVHLLGCGRKCIVPDLGTDCFLLYAVNNGDLREVKRWRVPDGSGPRHAAVHPTLSVVYGITELSNSVFAFDPNAPVDAPWLFQGSTLPGDVDAPSHAAEIAVHPGGKFLAASNRGHDSIAIWPLDPSGIPGDPDFVALNGACPRHFIFSPCGHWLIVALQGSDRVQVHRFDPIWGTLHHRHTSNINVASPAAICIY